MKVGMKFRPLYTLSRVWIMPQVYFRTIDSVIAGRGSQGR